MDLWCQARQHVCEWNAQINFVYNNLTWLHAISYPQNTVPTAPCWKKICPLPPPHPFTESLPCIAKGSTMHVPTLYLVPGKDTLVHRVGSAYVAFQRDASRLPSRRIWRFWNPFDTYNLMLIQLRTLPALLLLMMLCTKSIFQLAPTNLWETPLLNPDEVTWQVESHAPKICQDTIGTSHVVRFLALANPIAQHMWLLWLLAFQCWGLMPRCLCDARPRASTNQWKGYNKNGTCWMLMFKRKKWCDMVA